MPLPKRRKTNSKDSRSGTPVPTSNANSRVSTPVPPSATGTHEHPQLDSAPCDPDALPDLVLTSERRRGIYECDYCHSDISQQPRIRCAVCPDFDLCLDCFVTSDHASAIARLKAAVEVREAVIADQQQAANAAAPSAATAPLVSEGKQGGGKQGKSSTATTNATSAAAIDNDDQTASVPVGMTGWHTASNAINHNHTHGYRVCDNTRYPMFPTSRKVATGSRPGSATGSTISNGKSGEPEPTVGGESQLSLQAEDLKLVWTVEEDLRLLDAIQTHGLGNWSDISEAVSAQGSFGKNARRCMERYFDDFLGRYGHILPPYTLVDQENAKEEEHLNEEDNEDGSTNGGETKEDSAANPNDDDTTASAASANNDSATPGTGNGGSSITSPNPFDPTRLSKRKHAIMSRTTSTASVQSMSRLASHNMKVVPTESLPEYPAAVKLFKPYVPKTDPPVKMGQEVGRDLAYKAETYFAKITQASGNAPVSAEEAKKIRAEWQATRLNQPGGPTVLPYRPEDNATLPGAELAGFMPRRGDFDIEWDNDAEKTLADMEFLPGDPEEDRKLKLKVLAIYNDKLDEREKRKQFILSRDLHDYKKAQARDDSLPRDERDLVRRMRLIERFHTPEEHEQFIADVLKAKRLRKEIAKLQMYRRMGMTSLAEAEKFELDKRRRQVHKQAVLAKEASVAAAAATTATLGGDAAGAKSGDDGAKSNEADVGTSLWKSYKTSGDRKARRRGSLSRSSDGEEDANKKDDDVVMEDAAAKNAAKTDAMMVEQCETGTEKPIATGDKEGGEDHDADFKIEQMADFDLLSSKEAILCRRLRLSPQNYMEVKKVLIQEALNKGLLDKESGNSNGRRTIFTIDVEKRGDVTDFMMQAGWLSSKIGSQMARSTT